MPADRTNRGNRTPRPLIPNLTTVTVLTAILSTGALRAHAQSANLEELRKQIQQYEAISARADPPAMAPLAAGRIWSHLGQLYEDAGQYAQSETAFVRAIRLLKTVPGDDADLAGAIDGLGSLYMMRGDIQQAERAEQKALSIRQAKHLAADLAQSWFHLAALALRERQFEKARGYAQRAVEQLLQQPHPDPDEQINARFVLGLALCRLDRFPEAIAIMQSAMEIVKRTYAPSDFPYGFGSFLLGLAYWKSGDADTARDLMKTGSAVVENLLGINHPACVAIMAEYERYLRSTRQNQEARAVEDKLKQANGVEGLRKGQGTLDIAALF